MPVKRKTRYTQISSGRNYSWVWVVLLIASGLVAGEIFNIWNSRKWDGKTRFTVLSLGTTTELLTVDPQLNAEGVRVVIPEDLIVNTVDGKGSWNMYAVSRLAAKNGEEWVLESVENTLGIKITGMSEKMNLWDMAGWWLLTKNMEWKQINLEDSGAISEASDPDGQKVLGLTSSWKDRSEGYFSSMVLASEALNVSVFNTTDKPGLGANFARFIESAGIKVVGLGERSNVKEYCLIEVNQETGKRIGVTWMVRVLGCKTEIDETLTEGEVNILVGNDFAEWVGGV